ncbi:TOBE domain-containing protein, partial [Rhodopseudomonas sp. BAL398]
LARAGAPNPGGAGGGGARGPPPRPRAGGGGGAPPRPPPPATIEIGIRPEFVHIAPMAPGLLAATIDRIDDLGRVRFAQLRIGDVKFAARVPEGFAIPEKDVGLVFETARIHVYADSRLVEGQSLEQVA